MFDAELHTIEFAEGKHWIKITPYETEADFSAQLNALSPIVGKMKFDLAEGSASSGDSDYQISVTRKVVLGRRIKEWSWPEEISDDSISALPHFVTQKVLDAIEELEDSHTVDELEKKYLS